MPDGVDHDQTARSVQSDLDRYRAQNLFRTAKNKEREIDKVNGDDLIYLRAFSDSWDARKQLTSYLQVY